MVIRRRSEAGNQKVLIFPSPSIFPRCKGPQAYHFHPHQSAQVNFLLQYYRHKQTNTKAQVNYSVGHLGYILINSGKHN